MKLIYSLLLAFVLPLTYAETPAEKAKYAAELGISTDEKDSWISLTIFFNKKPFHIYMKPSAQLVNIVEYVASVNGGEPSKFQLSVSNSIERNAKTRKRTIRIEKHVLSAAELAESVKSYGKTVFTVERI